MNTEQQQLQTARGVTWYLSTAASRTAALGRLLDDETEDGTIDDAAWDAYVEQLAEVADDLALAQATRESIEAFAGRLEEHAAALSARVARARSAAARIKAAQLAAVQAAGGKIDAGPWALSATKGREVVDVDDEAPLEDWPSDMVRRKTSIAADKAAVLRALRDGATLPGARLSVGAASLRVSPRGGV